MNKTERSSRRSAAVVWTGLVILAVAVGCASPGIPALQSGGVMVIVLDGQSCTLDGILHDNVRFEGTNCAGADDWPLNGLVFRHTIGGDGGLSHRIRIAHRRPSPPGPPNDSLFIVFEASGAEPINNETMVSFGLSRTTAATDARAYLIRPAATPVSGSAVGQAPATVRSFRWDGSSWVRDPSPVGVTARFAYNTSLQYWGVEARVHLPTAGVTADSVYLATHWTTRNPTIDGPVARWRPPAAEATTGNLTLPTPDPAQWSKYPLYDPPAPR